MSMFVCVYNARHEESSFKRGGGGGGIKISFELVI